jgi:hypothetical protein
MVPGIAALSKGYRVDTSSIEKTPWRATTRHGITVVQIPFSLFLFEEVLSGCFAVLG